MQIERLTPEFSKIHFPGLDIHYLILRIHFHSFWMSHSEWQYIIFQKEWRDIEHNTKHLQCLLIHLKKKIGKYGNLIFFVMIKQGNEILTVLCLRQS